MRNTICLCSLGVLVATAALGCSHERTVVRKETVETTMPAPTPVIEKRTTTTTEHSTTVEEK